MKASPFLSVVIPTRDRPHLLRHALWSVLNQSDQDFEVIVSDNPTHTSARFVFDEVVGDHPNFHYFRPESQLNMTDNWNFAVSHATGIYVTILEDKFALLLDCVEALKKVTQSQTPELINWYPDVFSPADEKRSSCDEGVYLERYPKNLLPCLVKLRPVLEKRLTFDTPRGKEGGMYGIGKIVFGAYHHELIKKIEDRTGQLFHHFSPDYTSMVSSLLLSDSTIDIGRNLCVMVSSILSNGRRCQQHVHNAESFYSSLGSLDSILDTLPIRGLLTTSHNSVAHDYLSLCQRLPKESRDLKLNWSGLYLQCEKELEMVVWTDGAQKNDHYQRLQKGIRYFPIKHRIVIKIRNALNLLFSNTPNTVIRQMEKILFKLEGKPVIHEKSRLWQRWTSEVRYHNLLTGPLGLNASLLFLYFRDHSTNKNTHTTSMKYEKPEITPDLKGLIQTLDPAVSSLIENLISQVFEFESGEEKRKINDQINLLEEKLENFRGMIARRDKRILKLEAKLTRK